MTHLPAGVEHAAPDPTTRTAFAAVGAMLARIGLIALMVVIVALATGWLASTPRGALPITAVVLAGLGAAAVGEAHRRRQPPRPERDGRSRREPSTPRHEHPTEEVRLMLRGIANFDHHRDVAFWRRAAASVTVAASVALLMLGLLLPERFAAPSIGLGLAGILAVRLLATGAARGLHAGHGPALARDAAVGGDDGGGGFRNATSVGDDGWHAALVDDALDDSFPASDPPSWSAFRAGPPVSRPHRARAAA